VVASECDERRRGSGGVRKGAAPQIRARRDVESVEEGGEQKVLVHLVPRADVDLGVPVGIVGDGRTDNWMGGHPDALGSIESRQRVTGDELQAITSVPS
jgi:hypothetical protein